MKRSITPKKGNVEVDRSDSEVFKRETVLISFETGHTGVARIPGTSNCYLQLPMWARARLHLVADR